MTEFEIRYTANELATVTILSELVKAIADLQDEQSSDWIKKFETAVTQQVSSANIVGAQGVANPKIMTYAKTMVETVAHMAAHKL